MSPEDDLDLDNKSKWSSNPLEQLPNGKWIFWEETWAHQSKEYDSYEEAKAKLKEYGEWLKTPNPSHPGKPKPTKE